MTTSDGPMTEEERRSALRKLLEIKVAEKLSVAFIADAIRCSPTVLSQIINHKYPGDTDLYLRRGLAWIADRTGQPAKLEAPEYVETTEGRRILAVCRHAITVPTMAKIVLEAGAGKTTALREFLRRRGDRAVYIQAGQAFRGGSGLMVELADKLGLRAPQSRRAIWLYRDIRDLLASRQADPRRPQMAVVIDEATTLSPAALTVLRNLHDDPACRVAVILADTTRMERELASRHGMAGGYEQLRSRFGAVYAPDPARQIAYDDVKAVAIKVLEALGAQRTLPATSLKYLHRLAQQPGRYRNIQQRLWAASSLAEAAGRSPTFEVAELDFAASIVGARRELPASVAPFASPADEPRARAAG